MFERFTERARTVVQVAQSMAREMGHQEIRTGHLLLALAQGGHETLAGQVLRNLAFNEPAVRSSVLRMYATSEPLVSGALPFSAASKKVLEHSLREALGLGHNYIGTEHILLALGRDEGIGDFGIDGERVSAEVMRLLEGPVTAQATRGGDVGRVDATHVVFTAPGLKGADMAVAARIRVPDGEGTEGLREELAKLPPGDYVFASIGDFYAASVRASVQHRVELYGGADV